MTQQDREEAVTDEVVASFAGTKDDRLREIVQSLTRHLHAFARDVRLTQEEWEAGIGFLTRVGHITDDKRQEFILLSDVLGLSMLTVRINGPSSPGATESTVFGPFFVEDAPDLLAATGRGPMRPAHLHFKVDAPGHRTLITHVFAAGDPHLHHDAVFGVKESLVVEFAEHPAGASPDGQVLDTPWTSLNFDIVLEARP